ncbi:MAG TPA: cytochrome c, partial [Ferruginibacter sp.]|nr:cytochrome c [Ferruginibacter sp.]
DSIKFGDSLYYREFYGHYSAACQPCHGAPGKNRAPWMVIYPESPDLTDKVIVGNWSDAELYWIIKHGIKNTGMMALGPTHPDEAVWGVTAFVKKLPEMTPEEYQSIAAWFEKTKGKM